MHHGVWEISNGLLGVYVPLGAPLIWMVATSVYLLGRPCPADQAEDGPPNTGRYQAPIRQVLGQ